MTDQWQTRETTTHQDHVIAHVLGATVLGYFILDEALHLLLDMGFIWTIYLDGEMMLLPQVAAIMELETDEEMRTELHREVEQLGREQVTDLRLFRPAPVDCLITEVSFLENGPRRRLVFTGEESNLVIETSLETAEIQV